MSYLIEMSEEDEKSYQSAKKMYNHLRDIALKVKGNLELSKEDFQKKSEEIRTRAEKELPKSLLEKMPGFVKNFNQSREFFRYVHPRTGVPFNEGIPKSRLTVSFAEYLLEDKEALDLFR